MQLEFPRMSILHLVTQFLKRDQILRPPAFADSHRPQSADPDDHRDDRAFLVEIMNNHPEAVQSETGMMMLMVQYPRYL